MTQQYQGRGWSARPKADELEDAKGRIDPLLYNLLRLTTPHGHEKLLDKYLPKGCQIDKKGNRIYNVGRMEDHKTVFSCHMDTVHSNAETIFPVITKEGMVYGETRDGWSSVLGADDKVGVYIMIQMLAHKIPGRYIFHVGEESGCIGSKYIMATTPTVVAQADRAIAFDRMHYGDIIRTQLGEVCCSDEFIGALAVQLNHTMPPKQQFESASGIYTDTANYKWLVPECTNLSVGYFSQHTTGEHFDSIWLTNFLLPALLKCEWTKLPAARDPVAAYEAHKAYEARFNQRTPYKYVPPTQKKEEKKEEVKPKLLIAANADTKEKSPYELPFEQCNFTTPLWQVPALKPFEVSRLPEDMLKGHLGVMAALWKRFQTAGGYAFVNEVVTCMRNYRAVMGELIKAQQKLVAAQGEITALAAKVTASCDAGGVEIADRDATIAAQNKELADRQAVIDDLRQQLKDLSANRRLH